MKNVLRAIVFSLVFAASLSSQAKGMPLIDHAHAAFAVLPGKALTSDKVREAIAASGVSHGWGVVAEDPGRLTLRNVIRGKYIVVVNVSYDVSGMQVDYVSSENLNYKMRGGIAYIHPKYNEWVNLLLQGVTTRLSF